MEAEEGDKCRGLVSHSGAPLSSQELVVPRTMSLTYHDGDPGKHDGGNQLPDPAWEGRQRTRREHGGNPIAHTSQSIPGCLLSHQSSSSPLAQLRQPPASCRRTRLPMPQLPPASACRLLAGERKPNSPSPKQRRKVTLPRGWRREGVPTGRTTLSHMRPRSSSSPCGSQHLLWDKSLRG